MKIATVVILLTPAIAIAQQISIAQYPADGASCSITTGTGTFTVE